MDLTVVQIILEACINISSQLHKHPLSTYTSITSQNCEALRKVYTFLAMTFQTNTLHFLFLHFILYEMDRREYQEARFNYDVYKMKYSYTSKLSTDIFKKKFII